MKTIYKLSILLISVLTAALLMSYASTDRFEENSENTIVVLQFKAQPEKGEVAASELSKLFEKVKKEPHFVGIKLHIDPNDATNIMLYEEWEDGAYYQSEHMETDYMKAFMADSRAFLAGPPQISFWNLKGIYE